MIYLAKKPCLGDVFLVFSILLFTSTSYWLFSESDDEKASRIFKKHYSLLLEGRREDASRLLDKTLEGEGPLDPIWLPLVHANSNGYFQLFHYLRILAADPEREETYLAIANLVKFSPEAFHVEKKSLYYADIAKIKNVQFNFLEKYGLLIIPEE